MRIKIRVVYNLSVDCSHPAEIQHLLCNKDIPAMKSIRQIKSQWNQKEMVLLEMSNMDVWARNWELQEEDST